MVYVDIPCCRLVQCPPDEDGCGFRSWRMTLEAAVGLLDLNRRFLLLSLDVWLQEAFDQKIIWKMKTVIR